MNLPRRFTLGRAVLGRFSEAARREWLVTNGLGGFASGTLSGANTRAYHALLVAALEPPLGRTVLVAKVDASARYAGRSYALACNDYADGALRPEGFRQLESFRLEGLMPVFTYALGDALLELRVWMEDGQNTTYLRYRLVRAGAPLALSLTPLCTYRDYHAEGFGGEAMAALEVPGGVELRAGEGRRPYRLLCERGAFRRGGRWTKPLRHRVETERGLRDEEALYEPGVFELSLAPGETATVVMTAEPGASLEGVSGALDRELERQAALAARGPQGAPDWVRHLALAADAFIVRRGRGKTVIAGYPWFTDWGRDTMIALPGLTLATGRAEDGASLLTTFARHLSQGMLPNRFPDEGETPEYNTVDATLWFVHAVYAYYAHTGDLELVHALYPRLLEVVRWHEAGTRYGIGVDEEDGLLRAGEAGVQLTWMDALAGGWVVTPRIGKPVEISALWHNALAALVQLADRLGAGEAAALASRAERVRASFEAFWFEKGGYLYDVIHGPDGETKGDGRRYDASLRPNQLLAVSLPFPLLNGERARRVVDVCARELVASYGLRSLGQDDPRYHERYSGDRLARDGAYHQGTVWSWLIGPFVSAHYRVYGDAALARSFLEPFREHLQDGCVGQIGEVFDGEAPFEPGGCFAQAWGVAEVLRAWLELDAAEAARGAGASAP